MRNFLLLIAIFFAGDRFISIALERQLASANFRYSRLYHDRIDADVVILGNSRAVNSFYGPDIERRFDCSCINLGYNGMSPDVAEAMLLDYLDRNVSPKLLILEATTVDNDSTCVSNLKPFWHKSSRLSGIARNTFPQSFRGTQLSRLFAFNCEMFLRALSYRNKTDQTWINRYAIDDDLLAETQSAEPTWLSLPSDAKLQALQRLVEACRSHNVNCQLVIAPYLPAYREKLSNFEEWKSTMDSQVGALVDLSQSVSDHKSFADRLHTNYHGRNAVIEAAERAGVFSVIEK